MKTITTIARTMSSLEIADLVESNHADVRRSIERIAERGVITLQPLAEVSNPGPGPKTIKVYQVSQRDSYVIVAQLSPEFTARLVDRWQELEARNAPVALPNFADPVAAARAWADATESKVKAEVALAIAAPKAEFVDRYVVADTGSKGFRQVCKLLKANEARFREFLIGARIMYRLGGEWMAHRPHIDAGRFEVKTGEANSHAFNRCLFTPKGVEWVAGEWAKHQIRSEVTA
jgi:phage antirepressor YoqD-like protein